jgi:S1-C subfamily serine protease
MRFLRFLALLTVGACTSWQTGAPPPESPLPPTRAVIIVTPVPGGQVAPDQIAQGKPPAAPPATTFGDLAAVQRGVAPRPSQISGPTLDAQQLFRRVSGAIVFVRTDVGFGSAVAVTPDVLITACHVLRGASTITLLRAGRRGSATPLAGDLATDRCFLRALDVAFTPVPGVREFDSLEIGERVYSLGYPAGLDITLGEGIVSAKRAWRSGVSVVQTTAQISPGSSGGGLFDARGNLVGVPSFLLRLLPGHAFAIAAEHYWR